MISEERSRSLHIDLSGARWRKSHLSGPEQNCVEVACNLSGVVGVRDSKDRQGPALVFTRREWNTFLADVKTDKIH